MAEADVPLGLLTPAERAAVENPALVQQARALWELSVLAERIGLPGGLAERAAGTIREADADRAERLQRKLAKIARIFDELLGEYELTAREAGDMPIVTEATEPKLEVSATVPAMGKSEEDKAEPGDTLDIPFLPVQMMRFVGQLRKRGVGDYFGGTDEEMHGFVSIAGEAGVSSLSLWRFVASLRVGNARAARAAFVRPGSIYQATYAIADVVADRLKVDGFGAEEGSGDATDLSVETTRIEESTAPEMLTILQTPERSLDDEPTHVQLARGYTQQLAGDAVDTTTLAAFTSFFDPTSRANMTPDKIDAVNMLLDAVQKQRLLEGEGLSGGARTRIRQLTGIMPRIQDSRPPLSVFELVVQAQRVGKSKQDATRDIFGALSELLGALRKEDSSPRTPEDVIGRQDADEIIRQVALGRQRAPGREEWLKMLESIADSLQESAGFEVDEISALWYRMHIHDDESIPAFDYHTQSALDRITELMVKHKDEVNTWPSELRTVMRGFSVSAFGKPLSVAELGRNRDDGDTTRVEALIAVGLSRIGALEGELVAHGVA